VISSTDIFTNIHNQDIAVHNINLASNMAGSQWVITGNHHTTMRGFVQHSNGLSRVILEWAVENKESCKGELALDIFTSQVIDLLGIQSIGQVLVSESQHTASA